MNPFKEWLETDTGKKCNNWDRLVKQYEPDKHLENRLYHAYSAGDIRQYLKTKQLQQTIDWYEQKLKEQRATIASLEEKLQQQQQESKPH